MGESLSKGAVAHACIFIICFGVAASKKLEEDTLGQPDPKQAKTAGKFKGFFASMAALREAGRAWSEQGCSRWCAEPALPLLAACAAAAVLTVVFARAEFFTLAIAGLTLELSDDRSSSTSWSPSCSRMAKMMGQQRPSPPGSSLEPRLQQQHANASQHRSEAWLQHGMMRFAVLGTVHQPLSRA